jgi:hypothetical protein
MAPERRRNEFILAGALVVLALAAYRLWPSPSAQTPAASNQGTPSSAGGPAGRRSDVKTAAAQRRPGPAIQAPSVHLTELEAERPKPEAAERNLFRFKPKPTPAPPPAPPPTTVESRPERPTPATPAGPPPPPPIALKFIGLVEQGGQKGKLAVLSDSIGHVFQGREGDIIEGQYRILKIGAESLDIAYLDGTGRRTVRLSGG